MSATQLSSASIDQAQHASAARQGFRYYWRRLLRFKLGLAAIIVLLLLYAIAIFGPYIIDKDPNQISFLEQLSGSSSKHWLGTDSTGRDVFARLIYGGRVSLFVSALAVLISTVVGMTLGALAGFYGGFVDSLVMRCTDAALAIPSFLLVLVAISIFGASLGHLVIAIGLTSWMTVTRLVRGDFLRLRDTEFVEAARSIGATNRRIILRHILPEVFSPVIVASSTYVGSVVLLEAALSYLGLGIQPPDASWGNMLSNAQDYMWNRPMLAVYPGLALVITVVAFNYSGEAIRRVLNVREA
jgi:peptide/nickel transport system permease protein